MCRRYSLIPPQPPHDQVAAQPAARDVYPLLYPTCSSAVQIVCPGQCSVLSVHFEISFQDCHIAYHDSSLVAGLHVFLKLFLFVFYPAEGN